MIRLMHRIASLYIKDMITAQVFLMMRSIKGHRWSLMWGALAWGATLERLHINSLHFPWGVNNSPPLFLLLQKSPVQIVIMKSKAHTEEFVSHSIWVPDKMPSAEHAGVCRRFCCTLSQLEMNHHFQVKGLKEEQTITAWVTEFIFSVKTSWLQNRQLAV